VQSGQIELKQAAIFTSPGNRLGGREVSQRLLAANAHYLAGLGYMGLKDEATAKAELNQAVQLTPDLLGAKTALSSAP
jgi:Tfp pilus assembly protein PilF